MRDRNFPGNDFYCFLLFCTLHVILTFSYVQGHEHVLFDYCILSSVYHLYLLPFVFCMRYSIGISWLYNMRVRKRTYDYKKIRTRRA